MLPQLVAALAACTQAAPEAEADPALLYSTGHVLPYAYGAYPYVLPYAPLAAGCTNNDGSKCWTGHLLATHRFRLIFLLRISRTCPLRPRIWRSPRGCRRPRRRGARCGRC